MLFLRIYLIGSISGMILSFFNYLLFLKQNNPKYLHYMFYIIEFFANIFIIGLLSWVGVICALGSIILRLKE